MLAASPNLGRSRAHYLDRNRPRLPLRTLIDSHPVAWHIYTLEPTAAQATCALHCITCRLLRPFTKCRRPRHIYILNYRPNAETDIDKLVPDTFAHIRQCNRACSVLHTSRNYRPWGAHKRATSSAAHHPPARFCCHHSMLLRHCKAVRKFK